MIVVSDTSPILSLAAVNRLQLLRELYGEIVVPTAVQYEFLRKGYRIEESWMHVVSARDHAGLAALLFQLDAGEAEAIVVATEISAHLLLVDEKRGRRIAIARGLPVTGLLGVLAEAKVRGVITACGPILDDMINRAGFWIGDNLRTKYLKRLGEIS